MVEECHDERWRKGPLFAWAILAVSNAKQITGRIIVDNLLLLAVSVVFRPLSAARGIVVNKQYER